MKPHILRLGILGLLLFAGAVSAEGSITGSIAGVVKDPTGAVIPGAEVTVVNRDTNITETARTDSLGAYAFLALPVGRYRLEVKASGFESYQQTDIVLSTNDQLRFDVVLKVGQVKERIEVTTSAVRVETANTQLGDVIKSGTMETLPLNGRAFTNLLGLQPGVVPELSTTFTNSFVSTEQGNVSISGQRETSNGFLINGSNVDSPLNNGTTVIPNLDSLAEFRLLTANFDAENGNYSGGLVSVVTKSGTNQFHGDAFHFLRNTVLDSRNFFDVERGVFQRNQFGGTAGGPLHRDKMFFFIDYQGTRTNQGQSSGQIPVPSPAERGGDFSALAASGLTGTVNGPFFAGLLSSELGYPVASGEPYFTPGCASPSQCVFPNGVIAQSAFSAPAKALLQFIPFPNQGPFFVTTANNTHTRDDRGGVRVDWNSQRWGMVSAYYFIDDNFQKVPFGANNVPGFSSMNGGRTQLGTLSDTKSFGATTLNELHLSFNRNVFHNGIPTGGIGIKLSSLGFEENVPGGIVPASPDFEGVPSIGFNNFSIGASGITFNRFEDSPHVADNFSKVIGAHTVKVGGQYIFNDFYEPFPLVGGNGFISFAGTETGTDFADFLIGAPTVFVQEGPFFVDNRRNYVGLYAQDSWRAHANLTVNYGLRWEVIQPFYEKRDQASTFVLGAASNAFPGSPQGYVFPGDSLPGGGKIPRTISPTRHDNFGPRIGIAYSPAPSSGGLAKVLGGPGRTSIRAGFGLFYTNVEGISELDETGLLPFDVFYVSPLPPLFAAPFTDRTDGVKRPAQFPFTPPRPGSAEAKNFDFTRFLPLSGFPVPSVNNQTPYSVNYNFTLQRQIGSNTLVTLGYVGAQGHHLLAPLETNPGNPQLCLSLSQPNQVAPGTPTCGPSGENGVYTRPDGTVINGTRGPFGNNFGDNALEATIANSNYNAFQVSVRHTSGRLNLFASYTYSKSLDNASSLGDKVPNPVNQRLSRALSTFNITNNFVISYQYLLPFDLLARNRRPRLTSGWKLAGITRFTTGFPITLTEVNDNSLLGTLGSGLAQPTDTPDFLGGSLKVADPRSGKPYFDTSLFVPEQLGQIGTANRAFFSGPGINNFDLSLQKDLKLTESKSLEFRGELFNSFNHAQFVNPSGNINGDFGFVRSARDPRIGQVAIKFLF